MNFVIKKQHVFYQLLMLAKGKLHLCPIDFERVIHASITSRLDYYNSMNKGNDQPARIRPCIR